MKSGVSPYAAFDDRPIFIGACPRSGTTLLRSMLNNHPEIALPRETRFITDIWESRTKWQHLSQVGARARLAAAICQFEATDADRFGLAKDELMSRLIAAPPTLGSVLGTGFTSYAERAGKPRWGDKRPIYARYLDLIFTLFPDAQFINVTRDPRAVIASIRRLGWYDNKLAPALGLWMRSVAAVEPWRDWLRSDQLFDVRYEDLVADPESVLARLVTFLQVSPDALPAMLNYHEHVDATATKYHARLSEPVTDTRVGAWASELDSGDLALVEHIAGDLMDRLGYDRAAVGPASSAALGSYRSARVKVAAARRKIEVAEVQRRVAVREPLGARLTRGQVAIDSPPSMPSLRHRNLGKP